MARIVYESRTLCITDDRNLNTLSSVRRALNKHCLFFTLRLKRRELFTKTV